MLLPTIVLCFLGLVACQVTDGLHKGVPTYVAPQMEQVLPQMTLRQEYGGPAPQNVKTVMFHWVTISHERYNWGRTFTTTLMSGIFNELRPATTSIIWNNRSTVPSLLYNLRHSHSLNIFFPSEEIRRVPFLDNREIMYLTTLLVPKALGREDLPLMIIQDDVTFAPDANARMSMAVEHILNKVSLDPFLVFLYSPAGDSFLTPEDENMLKQANDDKGNPGVAHNYTNVEIKQVDLKTFYGAQGHFYSPQMTKMMLKEGWQLLDRERIDGPHTGVYEHFGHDLMVQEYLARFKCNTPEGHCHYFMMEPAFVQHTGMSSAIQANVNGRNSRFHMSDTYPVRIRLPGYDADHTW